MVSRSIKTRKSFSDSIPVSISNFDDSIRISESLGDFATEESLMTEVEFDQNEEYKKSQPRPNTTFPFLSSTLYCYIGYTVICIFSI